MASVIHICNLALAKIGSPSISSLDEESKEASSCGLLYESIRDEVLQVRPWPSCTKRDALALLDETPAFEFTYAYQLPSDFLDMVRFGASDDTTSPYRIEGRKVLTNISPAQCLYIFRNTDTAQYEPMLVDLIATRMAVDLALLVAQSSTMNAAQRQDYEVKRQRARSNDGWARGEPTYNTVTFVEMR